MSSKNNYSKKKSNNKKIKNRKKHTKNRKKNTTNKYRFHGGSDSDEEKKAKKPSGSGDQKRSLQEMDEKRQHFPFEMWKERKKKESKQKIDALEAKQRAAAQMELVEAREKGIDKKITPEQAQALEEQEQIASEQAEPRRGFNFNWERLQPDVQGRILEKLERPIDLIRAAEANTTMVPHRNYRMLQMDARNRYIREIIDYMRQSNIYRVEGTEDGIPGIPTIPYVYPEDGGRYNGMYISGRIPVSGVFLQQEGRPNFGYIIMNLNNRDIEELHMVDENTPYFPADPDGLERSLRTRDLYDEQRRLNALREMITRLQGEGPEEDDPED